MTKAPGSPTSANANFNPHPPRGEWQEIFSLVCNMLIFQPTSPARGMTWLFGRFPIIHDNFNPHPPRGEWHKFCVVFGLFFSISTHIPREGNDALHATASPRTLHISTHIPREGNDSNFYQFLSWFLFYSTKLILHITKKLSVSFLFLNFPSHFMNIFRCESTSNFMYTTASHRKCSNAFTESVFGLQKARDQHLHVLLLSGIYFLNSKILGYPRPYL